MSNVLVFGGTRYFGRRLVSQLLDNGDHVTIATRGRSKDDFGNRVERLTVDRSSRTEMTRVFSATGNWDVVYDNICYTPQDAQIAVDLFTDKVGHWVYTSSMSVYKRHGGLLETDFDPVDYAYDLSSEGLDYGEAKRQAEAAFAQNPAFRSSAVRFPIVLGEDDYTRRLHFHVEHVQQKHAIGFPTLDAKISFISSAEAANFLFWLGRTNPAGQVNACSNGTISLQDLVKLIENETGEKAIIEKDGDNEYSSPFGIEQDWTLSNEKALALGFRFGNLSDWLPTLVHNIAHTK